MFTKKINQKGSLIKPPISKRIRSGCVILKKGEEVAEHVTEKKEEVIIILQGRATIIMEGVKTEVSENNIVYIPENKKHNVINESSEILRCVYIVISLN